MNTNYTTFSHRLGAVFLPLVMALVLVASACSGADEAGDDEQAVSPADAERGTRVETMVLEPGSFSDVIELTGTVEAVDDATLSAQSAGTVTALVALGRNVGRGTAVAQLDAQLTQSAVEQAQASVEAAQAQFELAEDNYNRQAPLYRDSIISAVEYQNVRAQLSQAKAQLNQAKASLSSAQKQLQNTFVRTPFAGLVEQHFVERGEQVTPGTPIARVVNTNRVKVTAGVPERYAGDIETGTPVEVRLKSYNAGTRTGRISFVGSAIDPGSRTFPVEIELENPGGAMKPQMVAQLFITRHELEDVTVVPSATVLRDEQGTAVFIVEKRDGRPIALRRSVVLGPSYGGRVVIEGGLEQGDEIVVAGQTTVTDGDAVRIVARNASPELAETGGQSE